MTFEIKRRRCERGSHVQILVTRMSVRRKVMVCDIESLGTLKNSRIERG